MRQLADRLGGTFTDTAVNVRLLDERGSALGENPLAGTELDLPAGGQRLFNLAVEPLGELASGELTAVEAVLFASEVEHPIGSLGIVLRNPDDAPIRRMF